MKYQCRTNRIGTNLFTNKRPKIKLKTLESKIIWQCNSSYDSQIWDVTKTTKMKSSRVQETKTKKTIDYEYPLPNINDNLETRDMSIFCYFRFGKWF